jgi:hypothetical protein
MGLGLRTLFVKEVRRFLRVPGQTLLSPLITTTLYLVVFGVSLGTRLRDIEGVPYALFIVPGLVALGVVSNAFLNTASSLFVMKLQGTVVDLLVSPLSYGEILFGFVGAAALRGLLIGAVMWLVAGLFGGFHLAHPLFAVGMLVLVAVAFAALGFMTAVWADSFEQVAEPGLLHRGRGPVRAARPVGFPPRGGRPDRRAAVRWGARGRLRHAADGVQAEGLTSARAGAARRPAIPRLRRTAARSGRGESVLAGIDSFRPLVMVRPLGFLADVHFGGSCPWVVCSLSRSSSSLPSPARRLRHPSR